MVFGLIIQDEKEKRGFWSQRVEFISCLIDFLFGIFKENYNFLFDEEVFMKRNIYILKMVQMYIKWYI